MSWTLYLWRCEGCGTLFATESRKRDGAVRRHYGDSPECGYAIVPFWAINKPDGFNFEEDVDDDG